MRHVLIAVLLSLMLFGCANNTADLAKQSQSISDAVNNATAATAALKTQLEATKAQTAAVGGNTKPIDATIHVVDQATANVAKAAPAVNAVNASLQASAAHGTDPTAAGLSAAGAGATAAAPLAGPYAGYLALAGIGLSLLGNLLQARKNAQQATAAQKNVDAVQSAIASGLITIPDPAKASAAVNAVVASHPTGDALVDVVAGAK